MWLLDANLDIHLVDVFRRLQVDSDTAENRGWKALRNGDLVAAASEAGFHTLLTRDQLFAESASRAWRQFPSLSIVIITLPQLPSRNYLASFECKHTMNPSGA
jgi:predicted nuclease of predicted toxin-antitoxin system